MTTIQYEPYRLFLSQRNIESLKQNPHVDQAWLEAQLHTGAITPYPAEPSLQPPKQ